MKGAPGGNARDGIQARPMNPPTPTTSPSPTPISEIPMVSAVSSCPMAILQTVVGSNLFYLGSWPKFNQTAI